jgi:two-component system chemotaxis response regulator CheV
MTAQKPEAVSARGQDMLAGVDARTNLAGTNRMELLLFKVGSPETYGINVFKVKEVMPQVPITRPPGSHEFIAGMASLRGQLVPVIDLIGLCGNAPPATPPVMIVTEFSHTTQAFLVESVETIVRIDWSDVHQPPAMLSGNSKLTGVTRLADGRLAAILDVEQILHMLAGKGDLIDIPESVVADETLPADIQIFFADDSALARSQLTQILDKIGLKSEFAVNGLEAWARLDAIAAAAAAADIRLADVLPIIITDIEMPEMDGFMLTRNIKADRRFDGVKVLLHSSMSESSNRGKGLAMGADGFLAKFDPTDVADSIHAILSEKFKRVPTA